MKDWIILKTQGFEVVYDLLTKAHAISSLHALIGAPGYGKTLTFEMYRKEHENVYYFKIEKVYTPKEFYLKLLSILGVYDYTTRVPLKSMADRVSSLLNDRKEKILLIFDEAGKFSPDMMEYFQTIRDATDQHVGIILSGPDKFQTDMDTWNSKNYKGIPELYSRIYSWEIVPKPTDNEKYQIIKKNGVTDPKEIKRIVKKSPDLRQVYQEVIGYRYKVLLTKKEQEAPLTTV